MSVKAYCSKDGTISVSHEVPAVAKAFLQGKRSEVTRFLNVIAKVSFYGIYSVPNITGRNPDRDFVTLQKFTQQARSTLATYQNGNQFLSLEVIL